MVCLHLVNTILGAVLGPVEEGLHDDGAEESLGGSVAEESLGGSVLDGAVSDDEQGMGRPVAEILAWLDEVAANEELGFGAGGNGWPEDVEEWGDDADDADDEWDGADAEGDEFNNE